MYVHKENMKTELRKRAEIEDKLKKERLQHSLEIFSSIVQGFEC